MCWWTTFTKCRICAGMYDQKCYHGIFLRLWWFHSISLYIFYALYRFVVYLKYLKRYGLGVRVCESEAKVLASQFHWCYNDHNINPLSVFQHVFCWGDGVGWCYDQEQHWWLDKFCSVSSFDVLQIFKAAASFLVTISSGAYSVSLCLSSSCFFIL